MRVTIATEFKRCCDIVERSHVFKCLSALNDLSAEQDIAGLTTSQATAVLVAPHMETDYELHYTSPSFFVVLQIKCRTGIDFGTLKVVFRNCFHHLIPGIVCSITDTSRQQSIFHL